MEKKLYDVTIIGGGPGGYTAALYCTRAGMSTLVLEQLSPGGQMATTTQIENYPGFEESVDGFDLGEKMMNAAHRFGAETAFAEVTEVDLRGTIKQITSSEGSVESRTVIVATGASPRELGLPHETELRNRGMAYCATCDGMAFRDKTVVVVGGGNTAAADALFLSKICKKVYLVHRRDSLRATKIYVTPLEKAENIEFVWNAKVTELLYDKQITGVKIENLQTGEMKELACDGVFAAIGRIPNTELFQNQLALDPQGYVVADESTVTNLPGVYAVGDVRTKALRQIVTAAADGATASHYIEQYLASIH